MAKNDYNHQKIEKKWQKEWDKKKIYKTLSAKDAKAKKKKPRKNQEKY